MQKRKNKSEYIPYISIHIYVCIGMSSGFLRIRCCITRYPHHRVKRDRTRKKKRSKMKGSCLSLSTLHTINNFHLYASLSLCCTACFCPAGSVSANTTAALFTFFTVLAHFQDLLVCFFCTSWVGASSMACERHFVYLRRHFVSAVQ